MKKCKIFLLVFLINCITVHPAMSVTKCINLSASTRCTSGSTNGSNWSANCSGVAVEGIAYCSNTGGSQGRTVNSITLDRTNPDNNLVCWCRLTNPAVSMWTLAQVTGSASNCATTCAQGCVNLLTTNDTTFKQGIVSTLSN